MYTPTQYSDDPTGSPGPGWLAAGDNPRPIFDRMMRAIAAHESADEIARELAVITAETFGDLCSITILNLHNEMMHFAGLHDIDPRALTLVREVIAATADFPRDKGATAQVVLTGEPLLWSSVPEERVRAIAVPEFVRYIEEIGISSIMSVPLKGRSGALGAVTVTRHRGHASFTEGELGLLQDMAARMAMALENALLVESLRRQVAAVSSVQAALTVSEERFRSLFQSTALGIQLIDPMGTVLDTNPAFEDMSGYRKAELVGEFFARFIHPEDAVQVAHAFTELKMNRPPDAAIEHRVLRKDGTTAWLRTSLAGVRKDPDAENVDFIVAMHENVTGRKRTEQYFQALLEATPDALVMVDRAGSIMLVNRQAEKLFGYPRHEMLGAPVEKLIPSQFRAGHPANRESYLLDPQVRPMGHGRELAAMRADGTEVPVEVSLSYLPTDAGPAVVAAVRDITERRRRQAALVRSERSLAEAQRVARLGSLEYDLISASVHASDEALRILGMTRDDEISSEAIQKRFHPDDLQGVLDHTYAVINSHEPEEFEFRVLHPDGQVRVVHDRVAPFYDAEGKPTRLLGTVQDVTEQRRAEQEMTELKNHLQSSIEMERLRLAQDLHDGPMQDLYGAVYRIDELQRQADEATQDALQDVGRQVQESIEELRAIAKELRPPALSNFGLERAIRSYVQDFEEKHPHIRMRTSLARDHQMLSEEVRLTLFRLLQQALANVLRHSQASEVKVRFTLDAEEARLAITDNGKGFHVPSNWMTYVRSGHYGLAGAAERVSALGGTLRVESQPETGTTVSAVIPWSFDGGAS